MCSSDLANTRKIFVAYKYADGLASTATACRYIRSAGNKDKDAPHNEFAIGIDDVGNVTGADIDTGSFTINETHYVADSYVTGTDLIRDLSDIINHKPINDDTITIAGVTWQAGEVRLIGASGSKRGTSDAADWEVNYRYAIRPNYTPEIGDLIFGAAVKGWSWIDINFRSEPFIVSGIERGARKVPVGAYAYSLWKDSDFDDLYPWVTP